MAEIKEKVNVVHYNKNFEKQLCIGLELSELKCKCDYSNCSETVVNPRLVRLYSYLRVEMGRALRINSGYRCQKHNEAIGGTSHSSHKYGSAIDISIEGYTEADALNLIQHAQKIFDYIEPHDLFVHMQVNHE